MASLKRISISVLVVSALLYIAACTFLFIEQRSLLYAPTTESRSIDATSILLENGGETIKIWTRQSESTDAVIYFGGNAEDVSFALSSFAKALPKQNLYFVNYRGYGGSSGSPSEEALFSDAIAVYDRISQKHTSISVIGRSLGTGVAVYLASVRKVDRLVLITPFDSVENVAKKQFPIFPISLLLRDKFDSASRAAGVTAKTLVLIAEKDELIPRRNSDDLIAKFPPDQVTVRVIDRATHGSIGYSPEYFELIGGFL